MENDFWKAYKEKGLQVVSVDGGGEDPAKVKKYGEKHNISYPILLDPSEAVSSKLMGRGYPANIIIDQQGVVRYFANGYTPETMKSVLDGLLQAQAKS